MKKSRLRWISAAIESVIDSTICTTCCGTTPARCGSSAGPPHL
jgi:hypothetical protein